jgi:uncharacterized membrane protein YjjP (DUF1212 family)
MPKRRRRSMTDAEWNSTMNRIARNIVRCEKMHRETHSQLKRLTARLHRQPRWMKIMDRLERKIEVRARVKANKEKV